MKKIVFLILNFILLISRLNATNFDWENYFQNTSTFSDPHKTLTLAQKLFLEENKEKGLVADLGAGTGRDTLYLLKQGWNVLALDAEQRSIDIILERVGSSYLRQLEVMKTPFAEMTLPDELDLVNASYSLPFCQPQDFSHCWKTMGFGVQWNNKCT